MIVMDKESLDLCKELDDAISVMREYLTPIVLNTHQVYTEKQRANAIILLSKLPSFSYEKEYHMIKEYLR